MGDRDKSGLFHCSLKTVDLEDSPWYHTLSYTWGNPHPEAREGHAFTKTFEALNPEYSAEGRKPIVCDGKLLYINRNLYDAFCDVPRDAWRTFINRKNVARGWSRLHVSVIAGEHEQDRQLLRSGVDLNIADDKYGDTALHWAARMGKSEMVKLLVEAGARIDISNNDDETALDVARKYQRAEIVEALERIAGRSEAQSPLEPMGDGPEIWAWIDQVCINQEDLQERSAQVGIMDQIYQKSSFTISWLGREDRHTKTAVSVLAKLSPTIDSFVDSDIMPYLDRGHDAYVKAGIPYISQDEWDSLAALFQRQYFRRVWVLQEIVLTGILILYCGNIEVPWRDLGVVAQLLDQRQKKVGAFSAKYISLKEAARNIEISVVKLVDWRDRWMHGAGANKPAEFNLENLLFDTWHFRATDPRDKIYGLYGLLSLKDTATQDWKADYERPVAKVYADATKQIFSDASELKFLSAVVDRSLRNLTSLPSWVPDYSLPFATAHFWFYNAAGKLPLPSPIYLPSGAWNELRIQGVQVGTVLRIGSTTGGAGDVRALFHPSWLDLTLLVPSKYHHTHESRTEALWRTLCGNQDVSANPPAPAHYREGFHDMISRMVVRSGLIDGGLVGFGPRSAISALSPLKDGVEKVLTDWAKPIMSSCSVESWEDFFSLADNEWFDEDHQSFIHTLVKLHVLSMTEGHNACTPTLAHLLEVEEALSGGGDPAESLISTRYPHSEFVSAFHTRVGRKRLFVTTDRFIGLGPAAMKEGDGLWALPGAGAMFILRNLSDGRHSKDNDRKDDQQKGDDLKDVGQGRNPKDRDQKEDDRKNDDYNDDDNTDDDSRTRYMYIGEAYLHGCMNGEAVDGKGVKLEDVILI